MEEILKLITDNYIIVTIIACILVFSLIGYLAENEKAKKSALTEEKEIPQKVVTVESKPQTPEETLVATPTEKQQNQENLNAQPETLTQTPEVEELLMPDQNDESNDAPNLGLGE